MPNDLCICTNPFCGDDHAPYIAEAPTEAEILAHDVDGDWEGPPQPEYTESDFEAYDEMVRDDMRGYR